MARRGPRSSIAVVVSLAVAAVAGLIVTAAALDDDEAPSRRSLTTSTTARRATSSTTTTVATAFPSGEEWSITTALELPPALTPTTAAPTTTTTIPGPPPASPPAPGEYTYRETTDTDTVERRYRIEDRPPAEGEQRIEGELQFLVTLQNESGSVTTITSWRLDAVLALQTIFRFPETEGSCDWNPDLTQLVFPLTTETTWSYATGCSADFGSRQVTIDRTGEFRVVTDERITIADESVSVWRLESKETTRFSGAVERTDQEIRTWWFAPKYGLTVREEAHRRHHTADGTEASSVERELVALRPV